MKQKTLDYDTPIACLTFGQFMEAFKVLQETPIPPQKELPKFLTVPQLAEFLGYSISTVNIKNSKKQIPGSKKICGRVLFDTQAILDWIESGAVKTKAERLQLLNQNFKDRRA